MDSPRASRIEDWSVGGYAGLATVCLVLSAGALGVDAPYVGVFVAFWLLGSTALAAVVLSVVVVAVNADRARRGVGADRLAVACAVLIPTALGSVVYVALADRSMAVALALGLVAMVLAPLGLVYQVFDDRIRRRWRRRTVGSVE